MGSGSVPGASNYVKQQPSKLLSLGLLSLGLLSWGLLSLSILGSTSGVPVQVIGGYKAYADAPTAGCVGQCDVLCHFRAVDSSLDAEWTLSLSFTALTSLSMSEQKPNPRPSFSYLSPFPKGSKSPTFEASGSNNHTFSSIRSQTPSVLDSWALCV